MNCSSKDKRRKIASNLLIYRGEIRRNPVVEIAPDGVITSIEFLPQSQMDLSAHTEFYNGVMAAGVPNLSDGKTIIEALRELHISEPIEIDHRPNIYILSGLDYHSMTPTERYKVTKII